MILLWSSKQGSFFLIYVYLVAPVSLVETTLLSSLNYFICHFIKFNWGHKISLFCSFSAYLFVHHFSSITWPWLLYILKSEILYYKFLCFVTLLPNNLGYSYNYFRISFNFLVLIETVLKLLIFLGRTDIITYFSLPNHEHVIL